MKTFLITASIFGVSFFLSCKTETINQQNKNTINHELTEVTKANNNLSFNESKDSWELLKKENGNSYIYQVGFGSWTGAGSITEISIENNIVISRKYESYSNILNRNEISDSYIETQEELGKHSFGAKPITIDEMYEICLSDFLDVDTTENSITFSVTNKGLLQNCSYYPNNCADDCTKGVQIDAFEWK